MLPNLQTILGLLEGGYGKLRILVIGDLMLDRYIWGDVDRVSPEAPVPVLLHAHRTQRPGGAANVAMNLAGLGVQAVLAGFWGKDAEQAELAELLRAEKIGVAGIVETVRPTISKTRIVGRNQQLLRLDIESNDAPAASEAAELEKRCLQLLEGMDAVILSDYAKGVLSSALCQSVIRAARARKVPVFVDPKTRDFTKYDGATTVCPNLNELSMATGVPTHQVDALLEAGQQLLNKHQFDFLTVTMSERGIRILRKDGIFHSPARARDVFDVSGAGDTVIATLAASIAGGLDPETAVQLANVAAAIVVGKVGTVPVAQHEIVAELTTSTTQSGRDKILNLERMVKRAEEWRASGESIVFTNGCFDILHVGHITLLEDCRNFGSKLIVGLNSDASVGRLKGPTRPLVDETARARVMAALAAVDAVAIFTEDTPLEMIRALKPDVLVKGGDYSEATVVGAEDVHSWGGRVQIIPTVQGYSTTNVVNKMAKTDK
jgi:D-beta-D-heptose 7-phosphate kinase/D-beta-D-heptose 1-phosphate adenosyltransferase